MKFIAGLSLCVLSLCAAEPAKVIFDQAMVALMKGDYPIAERRFQTFLRSEPRNVAALSNLAVIYSRTSRADQAIATYERALKISPDDKAILLNLGLAYLKQESYRRALPLFERVVATDPAGQHAGQLAALCRINTGQPAMAIRDLEMLRADRPRDDGILFLLGLAYLKNKQPDLAKPVFEQMFAVAGPAKAQFLLGKACYDSALFDRAEESFREVQKLDPDFPGLHLELGKVYISQHRTADGIRELELALKEDSGGEDPNYFLGGLMVQENRFSEGIPYLEQARKLRPDSWATFLYLGKAKLGLDQPADAVPLLQRAVELNPDDSSAHFQLARALQASGRKTEAVQAFRRARELAQ